MPLDIIWVGTGMTSKTVEILQYSLKKGTGAAFHQIMRDISVPLHSRHEIDVVAYGHSLHDTDSYYLIRAFDTEQQMQHVLETFYSSDDWLRGPREEIVGAIDISLKSVLSLSPHAVEALRTQPAEEISPSFSTL